MKRLKLLFSMFLLLGIGTTAWAQDAVKATISVTTNMSTHSTYGINKIIDGNYSGNYKFWSGGSQEAGQHIIADLGVIRDLQNVKLYFCSNGDSGDHPDGFKIAVSTDNTNWTDLGSFSNSDIGESSTNYLVNVNATDEIARYVKFEITASKKNWFQMAEMEVYISEAPERTITVSADETMGKAYIGTEGTTSVTQSGDITLTAVANTMYTFTGWTLDGELVSTDAEFTDGRKGDRNYVANFALEPYSAFGIGKPSFLNTSNNLSNYYQTKGEILPGTGVYSGSTLEFNPSGNNKSQEWSNQDDWVHVDNGATFDLKVTYSKTGWNNLTVFMIRESGKNEKLYGTYAGTWYNTSSQPNNNKLFNNINLAEDAATADAENYSVTFPITMPTDMAEGEAVIIRFLIHKTDNDEDNGTYTEAITDPNTQDIKEGTFCDYWFYRAENKYNVNVAGMNTLGDGNSAVATFSADKNFRLPANTKAYYATTDGVNEGYIKMTEFTGKVLPANQGFILTYNEEDQIELQSTIQVAGNIEGNLLKPSTGNPIPGTVNAYILALNDEGTLPLFYQLDDADRTIALNKAYLEMPDNASPTIKMNFGGEATGIENIETVVETNVNAPIYDLSGRRVMNATKGGIYIQNGKKFIVR